MALFFAVCINAMVLLKENKVFAVIFWVCFRLVVFIISSKLTDQTMCTVFQFLLDFKLEMHLNVEMILLSFKPLASPCNHNHISYSILNERRQLERPLSLFSPHEQHSHRVAFQQHKVIVWPGIFSSFCSNRHHIALHTQIAAFE